MDEQKSKSKQDALRSIINFLQGIAFTIFILTSILVIYFIILYHMPLTPVINYAIVFDAGSSHTEMFVYRWPADKSNGLGTTSTVDEFFVCPVKGIILSDSNKKGETIKLKAISDFEQHLHLLEDYFRPCLTEAIVRIPNNRHKTSPIFLGATAGMRLSRLRNITRAKQVLETIRDIFSTSPFQFVAARQVRILTGIEEAIDGWITTNILLEKFKHRHVQRRKSQEEFDPDMVGVLDLGGASTQVTFTYAKEMHNEPIPDEFTANITLFNTVYNPYAHSYLCWGKNEALKRHRARLVNEALKRYGARLVNTAINVNRTNSANSSRLLIRDPCLARGTNDTLSVNSIFRSPCTANEKEKFNNYIPKSSFTFVGLGNATQCQQRLMHLFDAKRNDSTVNCSYKQEYCTFDHTFQPNIPTNIHFIGLSGYYYVFNNLAFGMNQPHRLSTERYKLKDFSQEEIYQRLISVCETYYSILYEQESMNIYNEQHKRGLCFDAWYMWLLLTYGIGFKDDDLKRVSFANTFPTGKVGWTLGYMINQTNYIPAEYRERTLTKKHFIRWLIGSLTITLITFLFLLLTCYRYCRRRTTMMTNNRNDYIRPKEQEIA